MNEEEIRKIGEYLELKYVIAREVNKNDKLDTQDKYIQKLYDSYLDLKIKYNKSENKNKEIKERIEKALNDIQLIIDYGFDYDGLKQVSSLKGLIDMLVDYAIKSRDILKGDK